MMIRTLVAVLFLSSTVAAAQTSPCTDQNTITVTGSGLARAVPDRVSFTVGVVTTTASVAEAFRLNNEKTSRVVKALKSRGVKDAEIQTSNFTIDSPYDPKTQTKSTHLYMVANSVTITRDEPKSVSELIQAAIDAGANTASNLSFFNADPTAARDRAIELAMRDARAQAEKIAAAAGRTVGAATTINTAGGRTFDYLSNAVRENITVSAAPIEAGSNEVSYSVTVTYELK